MQKYGCQPFFFHSHSNSLYNISKPRFFVRLVSSKLNLHNWSKFDKLKMVSIPTNSNILNPTKLFSSLYDQMYHIVGLFSLYNQWFGRNLSIVIHDLSWSSCLSYAIKLSKFKLDCMFSYVLYITSSSLVPFFQFTTNSWQQPIDRSSCFDI